MLLGVVVVVLVGFTGYQALKAKTALEQVAADFDTLRAQLAGGDESGARSTLAAAQRHAGDAADSTRGPGWWLSAHLPQIGPNVRAVRSVALVADGLATDVLPDVVDASATLSPQRLKPVNGRIDLDPIRASAPSVERAASRLASESDRVDGIDAAPLAPQIAAPVRQLQTKIADAAGLADRASRAVRLLPDMLGGSGPRRYLFLFQNNAEIRATGGIPGSFASLTARDGKLTLGRQDDSSTISLLQEVADPDHRGGEGALRDGPRQVLPGRELHAGLPAVGRARLPDVRAAHRPGRRRGGLGRPDRAVPRAGRHRSRADGRGTDPDHGQRRAAAAQHGVRRDPRPSRQNDFYNAVARDVFKAVSSGAGNPRAVLENIATSASERRLLVWSARPDEQKLLAPTALAGRLETRATENPQVGVYFNAALPYKLDYYLDYDTSVSSTRCVNGRQQLTVTVDLASRVPAGLPEADAVRRTGRAAVQAGHDRDDDVLLRSGRRDDGSADRGRGATRSSPCSGWTAGPSSPGP